MHRAHWVVAVLVIGIGGCMFQQMSPLNQLTDQAHAINDEVRWARIDLASDRVKPEYRNTFMSSHALWGNEIQIAQAEMTNVTFNDTEATTLVRVQWYDQRTMMVANTIVRQHWAQTENGFMLDRETIASGDDTLLVLPPDEMVDTAQPLPPITTGDEEPIASR